MTNHKYGAEGNPLVPVPNRQLMDPKVARTEKGPEQKVCGLVVIFLSAGTYKVFDLM